MALEYQARLYTMQLWQDLKDQSKHKIFSKIINSFSQFNQSTIVERRYGAQIS